ncbi:hypothetical protein MMC14_001066 [Varicellaria rhodocarpa]|nr:hypothetical protein [Varicellaria rhodocarpa]
MNTTTPKKKSSAIPEHKTKKNTTTPKNWSSCRVKLDSITGFLGNDSRVKRRVEASYLGDEGHLPFETQIMKRNGFEIRTKIFCNSRTQKQKEHNNSTEEVFCQRSRRTPNAESIMEMTERNEQACLGETPGNHWRLMEVPYAPEHKSKKLTGWCLLEDKYRSYCSPVVKLATLAVVPTSKKTHCLQGRPTISTERQIRHTHMFRLYIHRIYRNGLDPFLTPVRGVVTFQTRLAQAMFSKDVFLTFNNTRSRRIISNHRRQYYSTIHAYPKKYPRRRGWMTWTPIERQRNEGRRWTRGGE